MQKDRKILAVVLLLVFILLAGCQSEAKKPLDQKQQNEITAGDRRVIADRLSRLATEVEGVKTATVVISDVTVSDSSESAKKNDTNNTNVKSRNRGPISGMIIMVGITLEAGKDPEKIKQQVQNKLKASDDRISQVLVTSDPDLVKKINDVATGIIKGQPFSDFDQDIKEIGKSLKNNKPAY